jgi:hypothetical protein
MDKKLFNLAIATFIIVMGLYVVAGIIRLILMFK